jgi:hypothetical protein
VVFVPEPCPDNCTFHGTCVNGTVLGPNNRTTYCLCDQGYSGINCGQVPASSDITAVVAGTTAGILAGIIVGIVVAVACFGGGGAFAYSQLANNEEGHTVANNPIFRGKNNDGDNPLHHTGGH